MAMLDKKLEILKYETSKHHRQNLRGQIDQNMIDGLEISQNPSGNYQKAFKGLSNEELQKSVTLHENKKNMETTKKEYDRQINLAHSGIYSPDTLTMVEKGLGINNSIPATELKNLNYRDVEYQDYDLLKQTRALEHTLKNYDGGEKFYSNQDRHLLNKKVLQQNMRVTLNRQVDAKSQQKYKQWDRKHSQVEAMMIKEAIQRENDRVARENEKNRNKEHCEIVKQQMQEERIRRGRKLLFNYNNMSRHNPITNPIEYHIDNPYILKQMQNNLRH